jgi:DNA-binding NarL/FixJ family response regulator
MKADTVDHISVNKMIQVLIADDHPHIRRGLRRLLQNTEDMEVVGEAADGEEAVALAEELCPHVVVMDFSMPKLNGVQALKRISNQKINTRVIIFSMHAGIDFIRSAMQQGAYGYVLKSMAVKELKSAIRAARRGDTYFPSIAPKPPRP